MQELKDLMQEHLKKFGQEHVLQFWDDLNLEERKKLCMEITQTDFAELKKYYERTQEANKEEVKLLDTLMEPVPSDKTGSYVNSTKEQLENYENIGLEAISENKVAVLLLASGQGTRLGVTYPKGMYSVNLPSGKQLYQLQAERLLRLQRLASEKYKKDCVVTWYIMTSEYTKELTHEFFDKQNFFGLNKDNVVFFEQSTLPCLTHAGKVILNSKFEMSRAPDGNGGLYKALLKQNILDDFERRGLKHVHVYCVDNILVKMADPVFIGFCIDKNANCAAKVVKKAYPEEPVGVICKVNDRYQVVEYSEISSKTANEVNSNGELKFNAGNICNHYFTVDFLNLVCRNHEDLLKHHIAEKKIEYIDNDGVKQVPTKANGIKLEKFVFDVFQFSNNFAVWEVLREEEFSPLKNADGAKKDTPTTCKKDLLAMHRRWFINAGARFKNEQIECEISPLVSYAGENLSQHLNNNTFDSSFMLEYNSIADSVEIKYF